MHRGISSHIPAITRPQPARTARPPPPLGQTGSPQRIESLAPANENSHPLAMTATDSIAPAHRCELERRHATNSIRPIFPSPNTPFLGAQRRTRIASPPREVPSPPSGRKPVRTPYRRSSSWRQPLEDTGPQGRCCTSAIAKSTASRAVGPTNRWLNPFTS